MTILSILLLTACGSGSSNNNENDDGISSATQQSLGKQLFFDANLSSEGNQSCGSCHDPAGGFADPNARKTAPVSEGSVAGRFGNRNAPTAAYAAFIPDFVKRTTQTVDNTISHYQGGQFLDGRRSSLIEQAKDPFLNPVEMNNVDAADVVNKVQSAAYSEDFKSVFGADAFTDTATAYNNIATAIAAFESSTEVNPFTSKFDAVVAGQVTFNASEQRGFDLFKGTEAKCANCHTVNDPADQSLFSDFNYYNIAIPVNPANPAFVANNNFRDGGLGNSPALTDPAEQAAEQGKFRTPTLRNIALTAPYMHNGVYDTLEEVIRHYDIQVSNEFIIPEVDSNIAIELDAGGFAGLGLQPQDYTDLENFMLTLTDGFF